MLLIRTGSDESPNNRKVGIHGGQWLQKVRFVSSPVFPPETKYFAGYAIAFFTNLTSPFSQCIFRSAMSNLTSKRAKVEWSSKDLTKHTAES